MEKYLTNPASIEYSAVSRYGLLNKLLSREKFFVLYGLGYPVLFFSKAPYLLLRLFEDVKLKILYKFVYGRNEWKSLRARGFVRVPRDFCFEKSWHDWELNREDWKM